MSDGRLSISARAEVTPGQLCRTLMHVSPDEVADAIRAWCSTAAEMTEVRYALATIGERLADG